MESQVNIGQVTDHSFRNFQVNISDQRLPDSLIKSDSSENCSYNIQKMVVKVYSIQVSGIKCTNCAGKIERGLKENLKRDLLKIAVNIIKEKVNITIENEAVLQKAVVILKTLGFPPIGQPEMLSGGDQSQRSVSFVYLLTTESEKLEEEIRETIGVTKVTHVIQDSQIKLTVTYNCEIIKGREIVDAIALKEPNFEVINHRVASFQSGSKTVAKKGPNLIITGLIGSFFMIFNMVLPFTGDWYASLVSFPEAFGIYTFAVMVNSVLAFYVVIVYGKKFIINAWKNYMDFRETNMETLIALGSLSAFALYFFFIGRYTYEIWKGELEDKAMAIMEINDALTSASIIVIVVTIGKHFEDKIKRKIDRITEEIFPESTLFKDMMTEFVELKNRQLKISDKRQYDVTLLEKNDIMNLKPGRLLLDVTVISGEIKAIQSAVNGNDEIQTIGKGGRIQSGSIISENNDALVMVENIFEKSILTEIGTQIKLAQNQEEGGKSGIQAVCKTIASYFVKGVIIFSIIVMAVWTALIYSELVKVPICGVCWVVERGIGVLVASCPCALGLAVPTVIAISLNLATKSGILIRNNNIFEKMKTTKVISFDKTGTLFTRIEKIEESQVLSKKLNETEMWEIVALVEKEIRHPLAEILFREAFNRSQVTGTNFSYLLIEKPVVEKEGIKAAVCRKSSSENLQILIGNKNLLKNYGINIPMYDKTTSASTQLFLAVNNHACLLMALNTHSNLRPEAKDVIVELQKLGKEVHILSGDSSESVEKLANYLEIPEECRHPQQSAFMKMDWIKGIQEGEKVGVLMVGDGLNDIPCLQEAAIGVSINAKSQLNINAASVVILSQNLHKILALVRLINRGNQFIVMNLGWAFAYNIIMMPVVAGVFYGFDFYISPVWSSIAMSLSSIIVVIFSQLMLLFKYDDSLDCNKSLDELTASKKKFMGSGSIQLAESRSFCTSKKLGYEDFNDELAIESTGDTRK